MVMYSLKFVVLMHIVKVEHILFVTAASSSM